MRVLIIGGSDAGISAALRIREVDSAAEVSVMLADDYPNYSICGLPFYISGETPDWRALAHRTEFEGVQLLQNHMAVEIYPAAKRVELLDPSGGKRSFAYDRLLVATGARPMQPNIVGLDCPGVFALHTMEDSFRVQRFIDEARPRSALIIGAGYIGVEMADALTHRGIAVTLVSRPDAVFPSVDPAIGQLLEEELRFHGVKVRVGREVSSIQPKEGTTLLVSGSGNFAETAELVLFAVGVRPNSELASKAGVTLGARGALKVDRRMQTNLPGVFAAGDCVETWHRILASNVYLPLGTTAHKQGRVAGENMVGGVQEFAGVVGTQAVKVFRLVAARTGLTEVEALQAGFQPQLVEAEFWDHKAYYPGATKLRVRLLGDGGTGRLLGAQVLGQWGSEVAKRIDVFATALFHGMRVEDLNELDLSYTPPVSSPWDPVQAAAQTWAETFRKRALTRTGEQGDM